MIGLIIPLHRAGAGRSCGRSSGETSEQVGDFCARRAACAADGGAGVARISSNSLFLGDGGGEPTLRVPTAASLGWRWEGETLLVRLCGVGCSLLRWSLLTGGFCGLKGWKAPAAGLVRLPVGCQRCARHLLKADCLFHRNPPGSELCSTSQFWKSSLCSVTGSRAGLCSQPLCSLCLLHLRRKPLCSAAVPALRAGSNPSWRSSAEGCCGAGVSISICGAILRLKLPSGLLLQHTTQLFVPEQHQLCAASASSSRAPRDRGFVSR